MGISLAVLLVLISTLGNGIASVLFKKASAETKNVFKLVFNDLFIFGAMIYCVGVALYLFALTSADLSLLYPIAATQYIWVCVFAIKFFKEKMNMLKWGGILLIIVGVAFIGLGF